MRISRYKASGLSDGVHVYSVFKSKACAIRFAESLTNFEVYDIVTKTYIHGNTKFFQMLQESYKGNGNA